MRLLTYDKGQLVLQTFDTGPVPPYAILSHTWHTDNSHEVSFQDLEVGRAKYKTGYAKIQFCGQQAERVGLHYFWVDTCCIDQSNNTELTEAINSMFDWYRRSSRCFVYLADVSTFERIQNDKRVRLSWEDMFEQSRWFSRGWTLQELIAPSLVDFFSENEEHLGTKATLAQRINSITGINETALVADNVSDFSAEERLAWVKNRQTKRPEDRAYCLLGILGVRMRLDYGEGEEAAFMRLKKKIQKFSGPPNTQQQHEAVMRWLSPIDYAAQQHDIMSRKEEGTGQWFVDSAEFEGWQKGTDRTLFCPGIPGAGKTMAAAIAIDHLCKRAHSEDIGVAYVFCSYKAQAEQTCDALLAALLKQLAQSQIDVARSVTLLHEMHQKQKTRPSLEKIFTTLQTACSVPSVVYIVVDALDECTDRDGTRTKLLDRLRQLQRSADVRLLCTSRFIPEIEEKFRADTVLEVRASEQDVRRYVAGQVPRLPKCIQRDSRLVLDVQDRIAEAVDGMFLLARLYVDSLLDKRTKQKAKAALQALKKAEGSLDHAYGGAIERIEGQLAGDTSLAKQALSWITYAQRPLVVQELCHALAIGVGDKKLDPDAIYDIEDVLSVCAGLVILDNESDAVRLVHYTTQEYFERVRLEWMPTAQVDIATACITYLSMDAFLGGPCVSEEEFEKRLQDHIFLKYAAEYWAKHAKPVQQALSDIPITLLCNEALVLATAQIALARKYKYLNHSQSYPSRMNGFHLAARYGLSLFIDLLLRQSEHVSRHNAEDEDGETPLSCAAQYGHEAVVKVLLEREDVEVNTKDYFGRTALMQAAGKGHKAVVLQLMERDEVDITTTDVQGTSALIMAADEGHEAVVELLLRRNDVDINAKNTFGTTALMAAAAAGHEAVIMRLLAKQDNVNINASSSSRQTTLMQAAKYGHHAVVKLLVERDNVDVNAKGQEHSITSGEGSILIMNDRNGHLSSIRQLSTSWTALMLAADNGHHTVVQLLLGRNDVDVNIKEQSSGYTALMLAADRGHKAVVKRLLERVDVDIGIKEGNGYTALMLAAKRGHKAVVELLAVPSQAALP